MRYQPVALPLRYALRVEPLDLERYSIQLFHVPRLKQLKLPVDPAVSPTACTTTIQHKAWQLQQHVDCWTYSLPRTSVACILEEL